MSSAQVAVEGGKMERRVPGLIQQVNVLRRADELVQQLRFAELGCPVERCLSRLQVGQHGGGSVDRRQTDIRSIARQKLDRTVHAQANEQGHAGRVMSCKLT